MEKYGLLTTSLQGNKKIFTANVHHPFYNDINSILKKYLGIDQIIALIVCQVEHLQAAFLTGEFAVGNASQTINLVLIGEQLNQTIIEGLNIKAEAIISRKINYSIMTRDEMKLFKSNNPALLIWKTDPIPINMQLLQNKMIK